MMPEPVKKHLRHKVVISTSKRQTALGKKIKVIIYEKTIFFPPLDLLTQNIPSLWRSLQEPSHQHMLVKEPCDKAGQAFKFCVATSVTAIHLFDKFYALRYLHELWLLHIFVQSLDLPPNFTLLFYRQIIGIELGVWKILGYY